MTIDRPHIRQASQADIPALARLISEAYQDVADRFGLTPVNCPTHPSNCTDAWIVNDLERGVSYFILESDGRCVGCAALEIPRPGQAYLERLSVLPSHRRRGFGTRLVRRIFSEAGRQGVRQVGVGIIGAQTDLNQWYRKLGFTEGETRSFDHLPFEVTFMTCPVDDA